MKRDGLALALERAAQVMAGTVTYRGYERELARALIELWQQGSHENLKDAAPEHSIATFIPAPHKGVGRGDVPVAASLTPVRSTYVPLSEDEVEEVRHNIHTLLKPGDLAHPVIDKLCDMAVNCLLYAQEIDRLRSSHIASETKANPLFKGEVGPNGLVGNYESSDKNDAGFEPWWQDWRAKNLYPNTPRMRDAARSVYESLAYSSIDMAVEKLRAAGHLEADPIRSGDGDAKSTTPVCPWELQPELRASKIVSGWLDKEERQADDIERDLWEPMRQLEQELVDAQDDVLRLHREKMTYFEAKIDLERQLGAALSARAPTVDGDVIFRAVAVKFREYPLAVQAVDECKARMVEAGLAHTPPEGGPILDHGAYQVEMPKEKP